ncbi:putative MYST-like histone acetyltransferase 1 [Ananas comosus]|uniref:Histone acetyltransferase n=1 Tax=Ananas comosus TaxID=4615 RepID=A0A199VSP1_ANACO|nr:putative MYST-like histone acetyltransferase 1 [Ananas comosus]
MTRRAAPLEVGASVLWRREGQLIPAEIVERRVIPGGGDEYEYYVHCTDCEPLSISLSLFSPQFGTLNRNYGGDMSEMREILGHEEFDIASLQQLREIIRLKHIAKIGLGTHEIDTSLHSPFLDDNDNSKLYFCEFCLDFKEQKGHLERHMESCHLRHPPGTEIYQSGNLSVFEVDGKEEEVYTGKLCILAKLFLSSKASKPEVEHFLFYILCEYDDQGYHMVAYFSKVKNVEQKYNLSCILTFPPFQRKGYAYEFSRREGKARGPERPLSKLGQLSYKLYWTRVLVNILQEKETVSIKELSDSTGIAAGDILDTLEDLDLIKYKKGMLVICTNPNILNRHLRPAGVRGVEFDASKLIWTPYHMRS